jgi:hypothetical protein
MDVGKPAAKLYARAAHAVHQVLLCIAVTRVRANWLQVLRHRPGVGTLDSLLAAQHLSASNMYTTEKGVGDSRCYDTAT